MTDGRAITWPTEVTTEPVAGERLVMEVVEASGRASEVAFKFRRDGVEVWRLEHCCAVVDRDVLRTWLIHPAEQLVVDEVRFMAHAGERVAVSLPGVAVWVIDAGVLATLRRRV